MVVVCLLSRRTPFSDFRRNWPRTSCDVFRSISTSSRPCISHEKRPRGFPPLFSTIMRRQIAPLSSALFGVEHRDAGAHSDENVFLFTGIGSRWMTPRSWNFFFCYCCQNISTHSFRAWFVLYLKGFTSMLPVSPARIMMLGKSTTLTADSNIILLMCFLIC